MADQHTRTFKEHELAGWDAKARGYDDYMGSITRQAVEPQLRAAGVEAGTRVLDVACGTGFIAAAATSRGAKAVGVDFAPSMVAEARKKFPATEFLEGDAEALPFDGGTFDAVICAFAIMQLPDPDRAIGEALRVLRPGGRYVLTMWSSPERHEFFGLVQGAIKTHGSLDVPLPPAPPTFRFGDPKECARTLSMAGFVDPEVTELPLVWEAPSPQAFIDLVYRSTVRTAMLMELQAADALERIHAAILEGAARFRRADAFRIGFPAVMAVGTKPS